MGNSNWSLPQSIEWYLDGSKWIVAIATGTIVFGFGLLKDIGTLAIIDKILFIASAISLGTTSISGVLTFLFTTSYANTVESLVAEAKSLEDDKENISLHNSLKFWYYIMIWSFIIGVMIFSSFGMKRVLSHKSKSESNLSVIPMNNYPNQILVIDSQDVRIWKLSQDSLGAYKVEDVTKFFNIAQSLK